MRNVETSILINVTPAEVIDAFLEEKHLKVWWGVQRSLVEKKVNGSWAVAWEISEAGIKYISSGVITSYDPSAHLSISNLVYFNPERQILGPMKLELMADQVGSQTKLELTQSGYQQGGDWDWYYEAVVNAWPVALEWLKKYMET
jgi:uncharacterized protein YndB with AHSA1/START domain